MVRPVNMLAANIVTRGWSGPLSKASRRPRASRRASDRVR